MKTHLAILVAAFNEEIVGPMIESAEAEAKKNGASFTTYKVSGAYEIPLVADQVLSSKKIDAAVVIGFIEKGETSHGEVMGHIVHKTLLELEIKHSKPIGIGIIGPNATLEQATQRNISYAKAAVQAVLSSLKVLSSIVV